VRRADRLFQIVQMLRRRRVTTAAQLASALGFSERTIYRDMDDLSASGVPILAEAGVGYALAKGFDLPPLMFTRAEVEALVLGARIVRAWADPALARSAEEALAKIEAVLPSALRDRIPQAEIFAPDFHIDPEQRGRLQPLREAIAERRKLRLAYRDGEGAASERVVRPLGLFFWGTTWTLGAWCELRAGFRTFRTDRIAVLDPLAETFEPEPGRMLADLIQAYSASHESARTPRDG
jgi:predicted DNA-binding transcriptional regulator YafY